MHRCFSLIAAYTSKCQFLCYNSIYNQILYTPYTVLIHKKICSNALFNLRYFSTLNILNKIKQKMHLTVERSKLQRCGYLLYETIEEQVNFNKFYKVCNMPDTFFSWFCVVELHVWLLMVRLMAEGAKGRLVRNSLVEAMWADVEVRTKKLAAMPGSIRRQQLLDLLDHFQTSLFIYDEGINSSDTVLSSALWFRLLNDNDNDAEILELCLHYIRKQVHILDNASAEELFHKPQVTWLSLNH